MKLTSILALSGLIGFAAATVPAWAADISWRTTGLTQTAREGSRYTREGTAAFITGEEAHVVVHGVIDLDASNSDGTARGEFVFQFKDGSRFTVHFVSIWGGGLERSAGIFASGTGRFAGMIGSGTSTSEPPTTGPKPTIWTGTYELQSK